MLPTRAKCFAAWASYIQSKGIKDIRISMHMKSHQSRVQYSQLRSTSRILLGAFATIQSTINSRGTTQFSCHPLDTDLNVSASCWRQCAVCVQNPCLLRHRQCSWWWRSHSAERGDQATAAKRASTNQGHGTPQASGMGLRNEECIAVDWNIWWATAAPEMEKTVWCQDEDEAEKHLTETCKALCGTHLCDEVSTWISLICCSTWMTAI